MNKFLKYTGITVLSLVLAVYILFLIVPFFINGVLNSYSSQISKMVQETSGFKLKLEGIRLLTTPKLTVGLGVAHIDAGLPSGESFLTADNVQGKLSLLPLLLKKIEIDVVGADNINANFSAQSSTIKDSRVAFAVIKDDNNEEVLEVIVYSYEPTDFLVEEYNGMKDFATEDEPAMIYYPLRYHFKRVQ